MNMWEYESQAHGDSRNPDVRSLDFDNHGSLKTDVFERSDQSWYVSSDITSNLLVKVGCISFHLHKYPLLSRSGRMNRIIQESSKETEPSLVELDDIPGGPEAFLLAAKFCYGIAVDLTATNISGLRSAAEYLEMTEDLEEGNLIFKTEAFLSYVVLSSWRDSIAVLKNCQSLSPWAENLQIIRRCSESIAWKACANPRGIRWAYTGRPTKASSSPKWNGTDSKESSSPSRSQPVPPDWWFEDVSILRIDHFVRVVTAIKVKGMRFELIGAAIMHYASKWMPELAEEPALPASEEPWDSTQSASRTGLHLIIANKEDLSNAQIREQRMVIESLISIIPPHTDCVSCSFLLRLLRLANMLKVAPALVTELEKRVGMQLEQATLPDLLIPSFHNMETLYDVELVQRLLEHFLVQEQIESSSPRREPCPEKHDIYDANPRNASGPNAKSRVARLLDSYLTEVSKDRNLSLTKFQVLAEALPGSARTCDDGLYRAVDSYLKVHPALTELERKRLCRVMDYQKLSVDACMHSAQNERLPLRIVVQVLFSEQVKISNAIANSSLKDTVESHYQPTTRRQLLEGTPQSFQEGWVTAKKDINTIKFELERMKANYLELQNDMDNLRRQLDKMPSTSKHSLSPWTTGWKKLSKFTKMSTEAHEIGSQMPVAPAAECEKKNQRRWRKSIATEAHEIGSQMPVAPTSECEKKSQRRWRNSISTVAHEIVSQMPMASAAEGEKKSQRRWRTSIS